MVYQEQRDYQEKKVEREHLDRRDRRENARVE